MKPRARKSTAFVSLVLVPLNLLGLGFTGCDDASDPKPDFADASASDGDISEVVDFEDPNDPFNLDPVQDNTTHGPTTQPTTRPLATSGFTSQPSYYSTHTSYYHHGSHVFFVPIPYRTGYYPTYHARSGYIPSRPGPTLSRSYSSSRSGSSFSHSSGTSRGGFGSTGHSMSSGS